MSLQSDYDLVSEGLVAFRLVRFGRYKRLG